MATIADAALARGRQGVLPRTTALADESYLDFLETLRDTLIMRMFPAMGAAGHRQMEREALPLDRDDLPLATIEQAFRKVPIVRTWQRFMRSQQEMMWRRVRESFAGREAALLDAMADAERRGPGRLIHDPAFHVPAYARREIHLQPGGYTDDPLGGVVFHYGTKVFYQGGNDQDELHAELAGLAVAPADGRVGQVLDLGCTIGQATLHLKRRFPEAAVTGLDVALPVLRYAHLRAVEAELAIDFVQRLAEDTGFDDGRFDMVMAYILFHELPIDIVPRVLAEAFRILRPGGVFSVFEFPNADQQLPPATRFMIANDSRDNCEPYSPDFVACDFMELLRSAGFEVEIGPKSSNPFLQTLVARKPA